MERVDLQALGAEMDAIWGELTPAEQAGWNRGIQLLSSLRAAEPPPPDPLEMLRPIGGKTGEERAAEVKRRYHQDGTMDDPLEGLDQ